MFNKAFWIYDASTSFLVLFKNTELNTVSDLTIFLTPNSKLDDTKEQGAIDVIDSVEKLFKEKKSIISNLTKLSNITTF